MSSIKDFKDQNGYVLAHAAIPDGSSMNPFRFLSLSTRSTPKQKRSYTA